MGMVKETKNPLDSKSSALFPFSTSLSLLLPFSSLLTSNNIGDLTDTEHTGASAAGGRAVPWPRCGAGQALPWWQSAVTHRYEAQCASSA